MRQHSAFRSRLYHVAWAVPVTIVALVGLLQPSALTRVQDQVFDLDQRLSPGAYDAATAPVRIIDVDDRSIAAVGQWPWSRTTLATLVERLDAAKPAAIAFDMLFSEADRTSPEAFLATLRDSSRRTAVETALAGLPGNDARFAEILGRSPVVLGFVLTQSAPTAALALAPPWGMAFAGDDPRLFAPAFPNFVAPLPILGGRAAGLGALNWLPDGDQIVRRVPLLLRVSDGGSERLVPSLALESLRVAQGASTFLVRGSHASGAWRAGGTGGIESVRVGALVAATGRDGDIRLHFTPHRRERFLSAATVLDGGFDPAAIEGRVVIVGSSSAGLTDIRATPVDPAMPGVEVQAQAVETLLAQDQLVRLPWIGAEIFGGAVLAAALAAVLPFMPAVAGIAMALTALGTVAAASWAAFLHGTLVDPLVPGTMVAAAYVGATAALFRAEQRGRRFVQTAFGRFVSPAVVSRLAADPTALELGGDLRPLTVMFTDIRNFTAIAETMDARALTAFMNRYLSPMTAIVLERGGTIDKYIGDAIMAFWNAPLSDDAHAANAVRAALDMLSALPVLRQDMAAASDGRFPSIRCGIGLATGPCVVGNFGSALRFDYSALGDDVNLASRLESLSKIYGVDILASEPTVSAAPDFAWLEIDKVVVAGRSLETRILTPVGDEHYARGAEFAGWRDAHAGMLAAYRERRFEEAAAACASLRETMPDGLAGLYELYAERCRTYAAAPPPPEWNGITRMERK